MSEDFTFTYKKSPDSDQFVTATGLDARVDITNRQYEYDLNEDKSQIFVLQKRYVGDYVREVKRYTTNLKDMKGELDIGDLS